MLVMRAFHDNLILMKKVRVCTKSCLVLVVAFFPLIAHANLVWPGLFVAQRLTFVSIPAGLLIETWILNRILKKSFLKTLGITFVINIVSTLIGALGVALGGIGWEIFPGMLIYKFFNIGTFNPAAWVLSFVLAVVISTWTEKKALQWIFKVSLNSKERNLFLASNAVSAGLAFLTFYFWSLE